MLLASFSALVDFLSLRRKPSQFGIDFRSLLSLFPLFPLFLPSLSSLSSLEEKRKQRQPKTIEGL